MRKNTPLVGIGVILVNENNEILVGKRLGSFVPKYSIPGGALELGETFEEAAIREIKEETNLTIKNPEVIAVTNNLETYKETDIHTISIIVMAKQFTGELTVMEPEKCERWFWCDPKNLPEPHFDASKFAVTCYVEKKFYYEKK